MRLTGDDTVRGSYVREGRIGVVGDVHPGDVVALCAQGRRGAVTGAGYNEELPPLPGDLVAGFGAAETAIA